MDTLGKTFTELPTEILYLVILEHLGQPVGHSFYEETKKKFPEYFQEEIARDKLWASVPKEVRMAESKESFDMREELFKDTPGHGKGLIYWCNHQEEYHSKEMVELREKASRLDIEIFNKHYSIYGITK